MTENNDIQRNGPEGGTGGASEADASGIVTAERSKEKKSNHEDAEQGRLAGLLGYHLRRAEVFAFQSFTAALTGDQVSPGLLGVLLLVQVNPGINQTRVGKSLGIDRSTLVSIIDSMEGRDLIERRASPTDRRSHALYLTETGLAFLEDISPRLQAHEADIARNLDDDERQTLIRLLEKLPPA
jgi:DNA-binding MarR family transcriptional regulator